MPRTRILVPSLILLAALASSESWAVEPAGEEAAASGGEPLVVCLGDSLTEGLGVAPEQAYPVLLEQTLRAERWPRIEIVNAGVSGSTTASAVARLQWQLRRKPDVLLLALGANDGLRGVDPAESKKNLAAAIDLAHANDIVVLLAGMQLPPNYGREHTEKFSEMFRELAEQKRVALVPFLLQDVAADPSRNLADGIHPNADGYVIIAQTVARHLRPLLEKLGTASAPPPPADRAAGR